MKKFLFLLFMFCLYAGGAQVLRLEVQGNYLVVTDTTTSTSYISDVALTDVTYSFNSVDDEVQVLNNVARTPSRIIPKQGSNERWWDFSDGSLVNSSNIPFTRQTLLSFFRQNTSSSVLPTGTSSENGYSAVWDNANSRYVLSSITGGGSSSPLYINVLDSGVVGDGIVENASTIDRIIDNIPEGSTLFFPSGTYKVNGLFIEKQINLIGSGGAVISVTGNDVGIRMRNQTQESKVKNLNFEGAGKSAGLPFNIGLTFFQAKNWTVENCFFSDFSGRGMETASTYGGAGISNTVGGSIINCVFTQNQIGLFNNIRGEYILTTNSAFDNNTTAIKNVGGNNSFTSNNITYNTTGLSIEDGTNDGHGIINGNNINHNSVALRISGIDIGQTVVNNHLYANTTTIDVNASKGINISNNAIESGSIEVDNSEVFFKGNNISDSQTPTVSLTGINSIKESENFRFDGSLFVIDELAGSNVTGWVTLADGTYTSASPLSVSAGTEITLPNDGVLAYIDSQKPLDIDSLFSIGDSTIIGRNGDAIVASIEFVARPASAASNIRLKQSIDIGGAIGKIRPREQSLTKGNGVEHFFSNTSAFYTLNTWEANGGKIKIEVINGPVDIYDISITIHRTHKAR